MQLFLTSELIQAGHVQTRAEGYTQTSHRLWHAFEHTMNNSRPCRRAEARRCRVLTNPMPLRARI